MEVVIRDYLYKNCDFLNKVLFLNENRRAAAQIQWQNNNDIYANLVIIKSLKFREDSAFSMISSPSNSSESLWL